MTCSEGSSYVVSFCLCECSSLHNVTSCCCISDVSLHCKVFSYQTACRCIDLVLFFIEMKYNLLYAINVVKNKLLWYITSHWLVSFSRLKVIAVCS
jgi:hypothetical protein